MAMLLSDLVKWMITVDADENCAVVAVRRNEIIAMFNTLSKLSQSIRTIGFMSALLEDPMSAQPSRILDT